MEHVTANVSYVYQPLINIKENSQSLMPLYILGETYILFRLGADFKLV